MIFLLEHKSERSRAVRGIVMLLSGKVSFPWQLNRHGWAVAGTPEAPLLSGQQTNARKQFLFTALISRWGEALLFLWWERTALLKAAVNNFLRSCCIFSCVQSHLFILKQWQSLCCSPDNAVAMSVKNMSVPPPPPATVWSPLPASACLCAMGGRRAISFC